MGEVICLDVKRPLPGPVQVIIIDLDDALLGFDGRLGEEDRAAIRLAQWAGIRVGLASQRPSLSVEPHACALDLAAHGGFLLSYDGGVLHHWANGQDPGLGGHDATEVAPWRGLDGACRWWGLADPVVLAIGPAHHDLTPARGRGGAALAIAAQQAGGRAKYVPVSDAEDGVADAIFRHALAQ